jgi:ribosomal protein S18 acetylase RimI-like enzyme/N-acetylglutamate synthase-like GNAT family acetyltransferase
VTILRPLDEELEEAFFAYCARYGRDHDESFIPSPSSGPYSSYLLLDEAEGIGEKKILGVLSLIASPSIVAAGKMRVAVLHALGVTKHEEKSRYEALIGQMIRCAAERGLKPYLFLPASLETPTAWLKENGFIVERIVHAMFKSGLEACAADAANGGSTNGGAGHFPAGFWIRHVMPGDLQSLESFVAVRNRNFREVEGSCDATVEEWRKRLEDPEALEGGAMLLLDPKGEPCGCLYAERDEDDGSLYLGTIGIDRNLRRMGLARALVRYALGFGAKRGFSSASLSVNESNTKALALYLSEGFRIEKSMACMSPGPGWLLDRGYGKEQPTHRGA